MTNIATPSQTQAEKEAFQKVLPELLQSIVADKAFVGVPLIGDWVKKMLEYNLANGKYNRGLTTVYAYQMLEKPEKVTDETLRAARVLGWCVEIMQAYELVVDDIIDGATTRRGVPCWYLAPNVGLPIALNDAYMMIWVMRRVLKNHFEDKPFYDRILALFDETLMYTNIGQHLDNMMAHRNSKDYSMFTIERYKDIVKYKTAYYTYQLPVSLGLCMTNNGDKKARELIEELCLDIGYFFQMQDDYLDCFVDESQTGKAGTDIQEGKCAWLAVTALSRCDPAQRSIFESCYGSKDPAQVDKIKQLYDQLEIHKLFKEEEAKIHGQILSKINALPEKYSPRLFKTLIDNIYQRKV